MRSTGQSTSPSCRMHVRNPGGGGGTQRMPLPPSQPVSSAGLHARAKLPHETGPTWGGSAAGAQPVSLGPTGAIVIDATHGPPSQGAPASTAPAAVHPPSQLGG